MTLPLHEIVYIFALFSLFVAWRANSLYKLGCLAFGYISLVIFFVGMFLSIATFAITSASIETIEELASGVGEGITTSTLALFAGLPILWLVLGLYLVGFSLYAFDYKMDRYFKVLQNIGSYFGIPVLMIGFEVLLVYGLLFGNEAPLWALIVMLFFIFILGLSIVGYLKMLFQKGGLKWERTGDGSWSGDWEDDDKEQDETPQPTKVKQETKERVPLNQEYLKKRKK